MGSRVMDAPQMTRLAEREEAQRRFLATAGQIFKRFERGSGAREGDGFGLGLAIGRELARRMGGELRLNPAPWPTCFVLELPLRGAPRR
jgi:signal transduction histidine kinase